MLGLATDQMLLITAVELPSEICRKYSSRDHSWLLGETLANLLRKDACDNEVDIAVNSK